MKFQWKKHCVGCSSYSVVCSLNHGLRTSDISLFLSIIPGKIYDTTTSYHSLVTTLLYLISCYIVFCALVRVTLNKPRAIPIQLA